ncbi:PcfJ domain-containing protein [Reyranella sp. CPCC 100927]|uniref:PcfJ domain-containing protein n=1 Tax=Reyranella sp. CPCC 100927 TaxID=2599616 RepID=UPI0011B6A99E|nr:PcfJ domain-containing protein [Reyranella sp. CPCC 100927]TWT01679.1 hypothetical protein FQU96_31840 [Reyranella sp. CPCC 100927]
MTSSLSRASRPEAARSRLLERQLRRYQKPFQSAVRALARRHTRLADLAASFPALLFALAVPRLGVKPEPAIARVIQGQSLAEIAAAAGIPLWLRKLSPEALARPIRKLPDGALFRRQIVNHLPPSTKLAPAWLEAVTDVATFAHEAAAVWIAREFVREPKHVEPARLRLLSLWLWFSCQPETFGYTLIDKPWTLDMRIGTAFTAANAWHTTLELHLNLGHQPIADVWLRAGRVGGYDFLPLTSIAAIIEEAAAMRNCVRTYGNSLAHNRSRLWSLRRDGERIATLCVAARNEPLLNIVELRGPGNAEAPIDSWWAARQWLHMHDLPQIKTGRRESAPLDRATWIALWRPYWLAQRRIPNWLPIVPSRTALDALDA